MNRPEKVAPAARQRVHQAIAELGYVRNESARALRILSAPGGVTAASTATSRATTLQLTCTLCGGITNVAPSALQTLAEVILAHCRFLVDVDTMVLPGRCDACRHAADLEEPPGAGC